MKRIPEPYRSLLTFTQDAVFIISKEDVVEYVNDAAARMLRLPRSKIIGSIRANLFPTPIARRQSRSLQKVFRTRKPFSIETKSQVGDGILWQRTFLIPLRDPDGKVRSVCGISHNISEQKQMQEALHASEETFRALAENSIDTIMRFDRNYRHLYANPIVEKQTGIPRSRFINRTHGELGFPPDLVRLWERAIETVFQTGRVNRVEFMLPTNIWIDWLLIPEFAPDGSVKAVITSARDITERKQAENELRESEEKHRRLVENLSKEYFFYRHNTQGVFTYLSPSITQMLGYSPVEFLTHYTEYMTDNPINRDVVRRTELSIKGKQQPPYEVEVYHKQGGVRRLEVTEVPVLNAAGEVAAVEGIAHDVTEKKRAEEAILKLNEELERRVAARTEELERSNKDLEQFAYIASHDLKEPLRMVANYVQLLERRYRDKLDADAEGFIRQAVNGVLRMQALIDDLLLYSKVGRQEKNTRPVDLAEAVGMVGSYLKDEIEESRARIETGALPKLVVVETEFLQLFQNLVSNALKFRGADPPLVRITARKDRDAWTFSVRDNGIGIDKQYIDKIFLIFQRLHSRDTYPGTGVGLAICKKIVESYGGKIWVESRPGQGSEFMFTIPASYTA